MAADVGRYVVMMVNERQGLKESNAGGKSADLITRDLLGGGGCSYTLDLESKVLDLDLQVPSGWEKRLDLKSGKVYIQRCNLSPEQHLQQTNLQDLNLPPTSRKQALNLFDDGSLDLRLFPSSSPASYQSVCTLDKVKFALQRAEKETIGRKRSISSSLSSSSPLSTSSSSTKESEMDQEQAFRASFAAGCPGCLLYVLVSRNNPKCPHCNLVLPTPSNVKKPRIDLNITM